MLRSTSSLRCIVALGCLALVGCDDPVSAPKYDSILTNEAANISVMVLDYATYALQGGCTFSSQNPRACGSDTLPFRRVYQPPMDFGSIAFYYDDGIIPFFGGTIVWQGTGTMTAPAGLDPPTSFTEIDTVYREPFLVQFYEGNGQAADTVPSAAVSAWETVRRLDVATAYSNGPYAVGIYLYSPCAGTCDATGAKWIVFLYNTGRCG
jgi:hypothetical protein